MISDNILHWESLVLINILFMAGTVSAALNPSAVYCQAAGYEFIIEETEKGQVGICRFTDGREVDSWAFLNGREALNYSYCVSQGYGFKHVEDSPLCKSCTVCILPDGSEVEVTELMGLSFYETTCGDGSCGIREDYSKCPEDCPSGNIDSLCDGVADGICDPDCTLINGSGFRPENDPDCAVTEPTEIPLSYMIVALVVILILILLAKRK